MIGFDGKSGEYNRVEDAEKLVKLLRIISANLLTKVRNTVAVFLGGSGYLAPAFV